MKNLLKTFYSIVLVLILSTSAFGSRMETDKIYYPPEKIKEFAKKVERTLAEKGAKAAIVARVGRPREKLPNGINYTHAAFAVYSQITTSDGRKLPGYVMYNLYQRKDQPNVSDLIQDYPIDFFGGVQLLEAGIIIPSNELQKRLLKVLASPLYKEIHNPNYSIIANPFTLDLQNCTEHTLDIIMAAIYETSDIEKIKYYEKTYFKAQPIEINPIKLRLGSLFSSEIAISDHPNDVETATFDTIASFLQKYSASSQIITILPDK